MHYKQAMSTARRSIFQRAPNTLEGLHDVLQDFSRYEDIYQGCVSAEGQTALIFMHKDMMGPLEKSDELYCDGTFAVS